MQNQMRVTGICVKDEKGLQKQEHFDSLPYGADEPLPFAYLTPARAFLSHPKNDPMPEIPGFRVQSLIPVHFAQKTAAI